jgi:Mor family transcriptional regulator
VKTKKHQKHLSDSDKQKMIRKHEDGSTVHELAKEYNTSPTAVAAYVANAHRK